MGRLTKLHRERLDTFLSELDSTLEELGRPFIPEIQSRVIDFMKPFIAEVEEGKIKPSSFLKNTYGHFWREISDLIALKFPGEHRPHPKKTDARTKAFFYWDRIYVHDVCFKYDWRTKTTETPEYARISEWRTECNQRSDAETDTRQGTHFQWGDVEYERLYSLAMECLQDRSADQTDNERCVRLIFALAFFTGRRPWEEIGRISVFREGEPPNTEDCEHADDWLEVEGIGKKADALGEKITIPVFNISAAELCEALVELRMLESDKSWFSTTREKGANASGNIIGALGYTFSKFCRKRVDPCFERSIANGYNFEHNASKGKGHVRFSAYDLRRMYCSYGYWRQCQWFEENGYVAYEDAIPWARTHLGHTDTQNQKHTATYLGFYFQGENPLKDKSHLKANPLESRKAVTS